MGQKQVQPKGVVAVFIGPGGHCIASASDFHLDGFGGFSLLEAQTIRVKEAIGFRVAEALASNDFAKHLDRYQIATVLRQMEERDGYALHIIPVGHEAEA